MPKHPLMQTSTKSPRSQAKHFFCSLNYKSSRVFWGLEQLSSLF